MCKRIQLRIWAKRNSCRSIRPHILSRASAIYCARLTQNPKPYQRKLEVSQAGQSGRGRRDQSSVRKRSRFRVVEAAGVEPASENVTGQETTCLFAFMPWALPQDVRCCCSERTRNTSR